MWTCLGGENGAQIYKTHKSFEFQFLMFVVCWKLSVLDLSVVFRTNQNLEKKKNNKNYFYKIFYDDDDVSSLKYAAELKCFSFPFSTIPPLFFHNIYPSFGIHIKFASFIVFIFFFFARLHHSPSSICFALSSRGVCRHTKFVC